VASPARGLTCGDTWQRHSSAAISLSNFTISVPAAALLLDSKATLSLKLSRSFPLLGRAASNCRELLSSLGGLGARSSKSDGELAMPSLASRCENAARTLRERCENARARARESGSVQRAIRRFEHSRSLGRTLREIVSGKRIQSDPGSWASPALIFEVGSFLEERKERSGGFSGLYALVVLGSGNPALVLTTYRQGHILPAHFGLMGISPLGR